MDLTTVFGLIVGVGAVLISFLMEGGHIGALFQAPAMILVIFGTFGAATITTSYTQLINIPKLIKVVFFEKRLNPQELIDIIFDLAQKSRKNGLLSLEKELAHVKDSFLRKAIQLAVDGFETNKIREILEIEVSYIEERHKVGAVFFQKLGGFSPTLGIIGTVLGLIHALSRLDSSQNMAASIASAFIATLWGVALANLIYLPIADKLKLKHQDEALYLEIISEGVISLAMGDNPRVIKMKLLSFLLPDKRKGTGSMKKRREEGEQENHERWLLTYSDLITLLLAFFIMMYTLSKQDAQKYQEVTEYLRAIFTGGTAIIQKGGAGAAPTAASAPITLPPLEATNNQIMKQLEEEIRNLGPLGDMEHNFSVFADERGIVVRVLDKAFFDEGKSGSERQGQKGNSENHPHYQTGKQGRPHRGDTPITFPSILLNSGQTGSFP